MELNKLSLIELRRLKQRVEAEIKKRDDSARRDLLKKMQRLAADHGMTLDQVVGKPSGAGESKQARRGRPAAAAAKPGRKTGKVPQKYRHPDNADLGWTGRGRKPLWIQDWIATGKSVDELLIDKS